MSVGQRISDFWDSVKPRTRRGGIRAAVTILGGAVALSIALFVGVAMAWNPYRDYSLNADVNARQWAVLPLSYTASSTCAECHADQQARLTAATHEGIGCQSCHGALLEHAASGSEAVSAQVPVAVPEDETCVRCHSARAGMALKFPQVNVDKHNPGDLCVDCHLPHNPSVE